LQVMVKGAAVGVAVAIVVALIAVMIFIMRERWLKLKEEAL
jgi:Na+-driven multidrug efflux pump